MASVKCRSKGLVAYSPMLTPSSSLYHSGAIYNLATVSLSGRLPCVDFGGFTMGL